MSPRAAKGERCSFHNSQGDRHLSEHRCRPPEDSETGRRTPEPLIQELQPPQTSTARRSFMDKPFKSRDAKCSTIHPPYFVHLPPVHTCACAHTHLLLCVCLPSYTHTAPTDYLVCVCFLLSICPGIRFLFSCPSFCCCFF